MKINKITTNYLSSNAYILEFNDFCIVIDPSISYQEVKQTINKEIKAVLVTHGHYDHVAKIETYKDIDIYIHQNALEKLKDSKKNLSVYIDHNHPLEIALENPIFVKEEKYKIDNQEFCVMYTPGHSNCSVTYIFENKYMFTGDFIFQRTIGRTNFLTGNSIIMTQSLQKLKTLKENYYIYPGHGEMTTLETEKHNNRYLY